MAAARLEATSPAKTPAEVAAAAAAAATVGAAGVPLHPQLLEALNGVKAQLFVHSESIKEINKRGPAHGSPKAGHDEVRYMFKELLAGQRDQNQKTEKLAAYVEKGLHDVRQEVTLKHDSLNDKVNQMQNDFELKFKELEKKYESRPPPLGCRSPAGAAPADRGCLGFDGAGGGGGGAASATARDMGYADRLKVVVRGWTKPQLKRVLEARMRELVNKASVTVIDICKRAQVCYAVFLTNAEMMKFLAFLKTSRPETDIEGDMDPLWGKVSQPLEQRKETVHLRCAARAIFTLLEMRKVGVPQDFAIDCYRQQIVVGDSVVCSVLEGDVQWSENAWRKTIPNEVKELVDDCKRSAEEFIFNALG